jgi:hypothetical protein
MSVLTGSQSTSESGRARFSTVNARGRRRATVLIMSALITMAGSRAGAEPPRLLMMRTLRRAALDGPEPGNDARRVAASLLPSLKLSFGWARSIAPMQLRSAVEVLATLSWPLDALPVGDARALIPPSLRRATRREQLLDELGDRWRVVEERRRVRARHDDVETRLELEQAEAELDALAGDEP